MLAGLARSIAEQPRLRRIGTVTSLRPGRVEVKGLGHVPLGARVHLGTGAAACVAEVVACDATDAILSAYEDVHGLLPGAPAVLAGPARLSPDRSWLGRIVDPLGRPLDGRGPLSTGAMSRPPRAAPPAAAERAAVGAKLRTGLNALDLFAPLCRGQRLGLFAGSGVGKSVMLGMLTAWAEADAIVVALIGERGREVRAFVEETLGDALSRAVLVVATSDQPAMMRREAAYAATAIAETLAADGAHVLLVMDSVTRFAMAGREIGLAAGEPPATRGYPPSVFAELPRLLERAGPGVDRTGPITAVYTVLVEGGDHDEPVADAVRGILDGHIVMSRSIADKGRYPAVDILKSVSRTLPGAHARAEFSLMRRARAVLATMGDVEELVRLGAYEPGSSAEVDRAIALAPRIEALLTQAPGDGFPADPWGALADIMGDE